MGKASMKCAYLIDRLLYDFNEILSFALNFK